MSQTAGVKALDRFGTATSVKAVRTISVTKYRSSSFFRNKLGVLPGYDVVGCRTSSHNGNFSVSNTR